MSEAPKAADTPKEAEAPKAAEEPKKEEKKTSKFALGSKFAGHAFGKISPKPLADKAATAATKDEAVDDSHTEAPSAAAEPENADEGEDALFHEKAILYRFDKTNNEWKERGAGIMKILKNKESKRCRILMRRNQTFKVCANHFILPHMDIKPNNGSDRALMWSAVDFADGEESHDVLSVKFKNAEIAAQFKKVFEESKEANKALLEKKE